MTETKVEEYIHLLTNAVGFVEAQNKEERKDYFVQISPAATREIIEILKNSLKEQEARVMTLEEVKKQRPDEDTDDNWVWMEFNGGCCRLVHIHQYHELKCAEHPDGYRSLKYAHTAWAGDTRYRQLYYDHANCDTYNKTWRCWTKRPTDEQRKAAWNE